MGFCPETNIRPSTEWTFDVVDEHSTRYVWKLNGRAMSLFSAFLGLKARFSSALQLMLSIFTNLEIRECPDDYPVETYESCE